MPAEIRLQPIEADETRQRHGREIKWRKYRSSGIGREKFPAILNMFKNSGSHKKIPRSVPFNPVRSRTTPVHPDFTPTPPRSIPEIYPKNVVFAVYLP